MTVLSSQDEKNQDLRDSVFGGDVSAEELINKPVWVRSSKLDLRFIAHSSRSASMQELASSELKKQRESEAKYAKDAARSDWDRVNERGATEMFRCSKCKQRKCTYYQKQTRYALRFGIWLLKMLSHAFRSSADEPMTTFVTCLNCSNRWRC